ncbi:MAG TPA: hypothetical protein VL361_11835 [Candidatus Limnocylindrales bacterium]|nr:hypothetical protein [Candidatus Limnocylindrales bacterium]
MFNIRRSIFVLAVMSVLFVCHSSASTLGEDFSTDPSVRGWKVYGDASLFHWDSLNQNVQVTWDSSLPNSYFYRPLGNVLAKDDDFALEFDIRLSDIATNAKSGPAEIAVGFLNFAEATSPNFWRDTGLDPVHGPRDLVEIDYFPAGYYPEFGPVSPSFSPSIVSSNDAFASGFALLEMTTNDLFHIRLSYSGTNQTLSTVMTRNGEPFGPIGDVVLDTNFTDFRVDTVAICSYSDIGDSYDSVLAHGEVDNLLVTMPPLPVGTVVGAWTNNQWLVQFSTRTNWLYTLERTGDFQSWTSASASTAGTGSNLTLQDTNPPGVGAFYRIRAQRP